MNRAVGVQFAMFAACGAVGTAGHYAVLILLVQVAAAKPAWAATAGFAVGALINYFLAGRMVFKSQRPHREALPRFLAIALSGAVLNYLIMAAGVERFDWPYLSVQLVATALILIWNFAMNRAWTFASVQRE